MQLSLSQRLIRYFKKNHTQWIAKGDLQRLVAQHTTYTPENVGRRLRELENDGDIEVKIVKGHAWYRIRQGRSVGEMVADNAQKLAWFNSLKSV